MIRRSTQADGDKQVPLLPPINDNKDINSSRDEDDAHVIVNLEDIEEVSLNKEADVGKTHAPEKPKKTKKKKVIEQETEDNKLDEAPIEKLYEGRVPYAGQNFFKKAFFSWATDYVDVRGTAFIKLNSQYSRNNKMHLNQLGDLAKGDQVEEAFIRLK